MVIAKLDINQAIGLIDNRISPRHLSRIQEIILIKSLAGKTYSQIAIEHNYGMEYIKNSGSELWKLLSQAFGQQITKSNCSSFIRRQISDFTTDSSSSNKKQSELSQAKNLLRIPSQQVNELDSFSLIAPKISNFQGRELELVTLQNWIGSCDCRFIVITGMMGCGKTTLAIKAAEMFGEQFHKVVYLSLRNSRELKDSIKFCLQNFDPDIQTSSDINKLLVDLTLYLKKYRCLLILDDLDSIIEYRQMESYYRAGYEQYAQFLRCLITSNHQSLIIANSNYNLKQLNYYSTSRVKFIPLKGIRSDILWKIFTPGHIKNISRETWNKICTYYQNNPELIKIFVRNLEYIPLTDCHSYHHYIPYIEEIDLIIEQNLKLLDEVSREIIYWLSFSRYSCTFDKLSHQINYRQNKILKSIDFLKQQSLIIEDNANYALKPMFKDYIQRYLIQIAKEWNT